MSGTFGSTATRPVIRRGLLVLEALIFDFDGLVIDTEIAVAGAWTEIFESHGHPFAEDVWRTMVGTRENDGALWRELERVTGHRFDAEQLDPARKARGLELAQELRPLPGVEELIEAAARRSIPLAVASSSSDWWVLGHLERLGLASRFDVICTKGDVARSKPFPDAYLEAVRRLGVGASAAVALEDSAPGIAAAKTAGLRAVAVPGSYTEHMDFSAADLVLSSLAEMPADRLLDEFAAL